MSQLHTSELVVWHAQEPSEQEIVVTGQVGFYTLLLAVAAFLVFRAFAADRTSIIGTDDSPPEEVSFDAVEPAAKDMEAAYFQKFDELRELVHRIDADLAR